jgi:hypothetical protein
VSPTSIGHQHEGSGILTSDLMMPRLIGQCHFCMGFIHAESQLFHEKRPFFVNLCNKCFYMICIVKGRLPLLILPLLQYTSVDLEGCKRNRLWSDKVALSQTQEFFREPKLL